MNAGDLVRVETKYAGRKVGDSASQRDDCRVEHIYQHRCGAANAVFKDLQHTFGNNIILLCRSGDLRDAEGGFGGGKIIGLDAEIDPVIRISSSIYDPSAFNIGFEL